MFIKTFRFFLTIILFSSLVVWLSNNPGKVEILWKNYLLETNLLGIVSVFFFLILFVLLLINIFSSLRNITKNFESRKNKRYLKLADESLDNIAEGLLLGDSTSIEKNSRMIKKYLNNDLFSSFMLFNSSLIRNDLEESLKYLRVLESIPRAKYIAQRGKVIVMLKKNENTKAKETLIEFCKQYPNDHWFHDKLSRMYALEDNWKLAHDSINNLKNISNILKVNLANLKILSGGSQLEAYYLSSNSVLVVKETVKFYINQSNLKKASEVINKTWRKLLCIELIETFMQYRVKDDKEILKRYKLILKVLKKFINEESNETKLSLAFASFKANIWGEAQNFLDLINKNQRDERMIELYKKIFEKTQKFQPLELESDILLKPKWKCLSCNYQQEMWAFNCPNCSSVGTIVWPKSSVISEIDNSDFFKDFLQNPLRHLPKMKRNN